MSRGLYVIAYDIADNRRRTQVAHYLEGYGERVQLSVFEAWLDERELQKVRKRLWRAVTEEGSVRIYALCAACRERVEVLGDGKRTEEVGLLVL